MSVTSLSQEASKLPKRPSITLTAGVFDYSGSRDKTSTGDDVTIHPTGDSAHHRVQEATFAHLPDISKFYALPTREAFDVPTTSSLKLEAIKGLVREAHEHVQNGKNAADIALHQMDNTAPRFIKPNGTKTNEGEPFVYAAAEINYEGNTYIVHSYGAAATLDGYGHTFGHLVDAATKGNIEIEPGKFASLRLLNGVREIDGIDEAIAGTQFRSERSLPITAANIASNNVQVRGADLSPKILSQHQTLLNGVSEDAKAYSRTAWEQKESLIPSNHGSVKNGFYSVITTQGEANGKLDEYATHYEADNPYINIISFDSTERDKGLDNLTGTQYDQYFLARTSYLIAQLAGNFQGLNGSGSSRVFFVDTEKPASANLRKAQTVYDVELQGGARIVTSDLRTLQLARGLVTEIQAYSGLNDWQNGERSLYSIRDHDQISQVIPLSLGITFGEADGYGNLKALSSHQDLLRDLKLGEFPEDKAALINARITNPDGSFQTIQVVLKNGHSSFKAPVGWSVVSAGSSEWPGSAPRFEIFTRGVGSRELLGGNIIPGVSAITFDKESIRWVNEEELQNTPSPNITGLERAEHRYAGVFRAQSANRGI